MWWGGFPEHKECQSTVTDGLLRDISKGEGRNSLTREGTWERDHERLRQTTRV